MTAWLFSWLAIMTLPAQQDNYLLIDEAGIRAARAKAEKEPWARRALTELIARAETLLRELPEIPPRGGQWLHWYSCRRDGATLQTVSPTEHRCPLCGALYRGEPYDSVVLTQVHMRLSAAARDLGLAFRFSGREEFARRAAGILLGYADRYRSYPRRNIHGEDKVGGGRVMPQTLDESTWLIPMTWAYALVRATLPAEQQRHIEENLLLPAAQLIREHRMGIHNIQCWKNSAVGLVGMATGRHELWREAVEDPERGFYAQIARGVTAEGLWWEGSLGYHYFTLNALWPLAEAARLAGMDLFSERYRRMYRALLELSLPDGEPPGFNDFTGVNLKTAARLYELAYARWGEPIFGHVLSHTERNTLEALLWGSPNVPAGPMVPSESVLLEQAGYAMLRSPDMTVAVRFGMHGGGHGHPDKLNIVTYGAGRLWGLDPGTIHYGAPLLGEWYRTTIAHNTVSVDERVQGPADGRLQRWEVRSGETLLEAAADALYPGVQLRRSLRLRGSRLRDRFECRSDTPRLYDWAFHAAGRMTTSLAMAPRTGRLGTTNGYQHLSQLAVAITDGEWWARWEGDGAELTLHFSAAPATEVITGIGPGRDPAEKVPVLVVRRRCAATTFDVLHRVRTLTR
ncbi:MAG: heparinase II/III family protein [Bryobacterales bacterium]|nr:heparinase II/III family protein [Bryobacteraceae bacterium]MDW8129141.1 heparinase II/III family protein [Bryobacterales bacterium]